MIATACSGCGRLEVLDENEAAARAADPHPPGHHAIPDDPDRDWICHGVPTAIKDPARHDEVVTAFETRSIFGLVEVGPTKGDLVAAGNAYETARLGKSVDIEAIAIAELDTRKRDVDAKVDQIAEQLGVTRAQLKDALAVTAAAAEVTP